MFSRGDGNNNNNSNNDNATTYIVSKLSETRVERKVDIQPFSPRPLAKVVSELFNLGVLFSSYLIKM